jgi:hypothetical protein
MGGIYTRRNLVEVHRIYTHDFMMNTKTKEKSVSVLRDELDGWVSQYVRLKAANNEGTVTCISCNEILFWKEADCCHYENRDNMGTRFYLPNLEPGCQDCNRHNKEFHIEEWGKKLTEEMKIHLAFIAHGTQKYMRFELVEMIEEYKYKVLNLKKLKGL